MLKKYLLTLIVLVSSIYASSLSIENSYVRATPPGLPNSAAFMSIVNNTNKDISILSASSNAAKAVELHTHDMKNGVMKMYQVPKIEVKAKSKVDLKPGGFHIMFLGLKAPLKVGSNVKLTLTLSNNEKISVVAAVKTVMGGMMKKGMHKGMKKGMMKEGSCGAGKCGANMKKSMNKNSCDSKKCSTNMKDCKCDVCNCDKKDKKKMKMGSCGAGKCAS